MDFEDKPFHNVAKDEIKLSTDEKEKKVLQKTKEVYKPLTKWWRDLLGKKSGVESVKVSSRLSSTPCVVVASKCAPNPDPRPPDPLSAFVLIVVSRLRWVECGALQCVHGPVSTPACSWFRRVGVMWHLA